jgi:hypothetical protein
MSTTTYQQKADEIIAAYEEATLAWDAAVEATKDALVIDNGYTAEDEDGNDATDYEAMKRAAVPMMAAAVARTRDERATVGLTAGDLFDRVLPEHPDYDSANKIELAAMKGLARYLWGITQPAPSGYVQSRLDDGLVLARAKVHRGNDLVHVAYVTDNDELILADNLQPVIDDLVKEAVRVGASSTMLVVRRPALAAAARRAIKDGNRKASLSSQPSVTQLELPTGTTTGEGE